MKKLLAFICLCIQIVPIMGQSVLRTSHGVKVETKAACVELECFSSSIIRVKKYPLGQAPEKQSLSVTMQPEKVKYKIQEANNQVILTTSELTVLLDIIQNQVRFVTKDGKELLAEKPSSTGFTSFNDAGNSTYRIRQTFLLDSDEAIYGLGQHQRGKMNQRNQTLFLQQANTEICIPLVHSIKGYALFWDNYSPTTFTDNAQGMTFDSEVGDLCDYYFVYGGGADKVVAVLRELTGQAPMFPLWTFGFWQSRERYVSQDELVGVVAKYRDLKVPLDGIIQDWRYWGEDHKDWNAVEFRNPKFPDPKKMINLRYRLLPYIYSTSWEVTSNGGSLMRALFSDFPEDKKVTDIGDEYMFGKSILVAPVISEVKRRSLYLPEGTQWIDFWTGEKQKGGQEISREAPIDIIPLYVKAGSIIPAGPSVQFATEKSWDDLQVRIYPGADGEFTLYEDEDDNYNYEKGKYTTVRMTWSDKDRQLTIHPRQGSYDGMLQNRNFRIVVVDNLKGLGLDNESYTVNVEYKGKKLNIKLP